MNEKEIKDVPEPETEIKDVPDPEPEKEKKPAPPKMLRPEKLAIIQAIGFDTKSWYWKQASEKVINKTIKFFS